MVISFFKKLKNFFVYGRFKKMYTVSFMCNKVINAFVIYASSEQDAAFKAKREACQGKENTDFRIIEIKEL